MLHEILVLNNTSVTVYTCVHIQKIFLSDLQQPNTNLMGHQSSS